jgi:hypothetical protein
MTYQKWLFCIAMFGISITAQANCVTSSEKFTITENCDSPLVCTQEVGPHSQAKASVGGASYVAKGAENTCCQLASDIQTQVCNDGHDSNGVVVTCN